MMDRRTLLAAGAGWAVATAASAHTLYPQWVAYRKKHLLIGSHRKDNETYLRAERLVEEINHALPKAKARAARAPHPQRLASLIGTDQMELAVLRADEAMRMRDGAGEFLPYGRISLTRLAEFGDHVLVAEESFPARHGWMVAAALELTPATLHSDRLGSMPLHAGATAFVEGLAYEDLPLR